MTQSTAPPPKIYPAMGKLLNTSSSVEWVTSWGPQHRFDKKMKYQVSSVQSNMWSVVKALEIWFKQIHVNRLWLTYAWKMGCKNKFQTTTVFYFYNPGTYQMADHTHIILLFNCCLLLAKYLFPHKRKCAELDLKYPALVK